MCVDANEAELAASCITKTLKHNGQQQKKKYIRQKIYDNNTLFSKERKVSNSPENDPCAREHLIELGWVYTYTWLQ